MIPLRVRMRGWMRYRDEQVADFTGANLIAICGENGAGKSSIFDAVTFALYGRHRLGSQHVEELISQDQDLLSVIFEFEEGDDTFRVQRSRGQKPGSAAFGLDRWDDKSETWVAVPGTDKQEGLQAALDRILRLSETAFTSSYLLPQDEATQFIDLKPAERFQAIGKLIELEVYQALAKAADNAAKTEQRTLAEREQSLRVYADANEEALTELEQRADKIAREAENAAAARAEARVRAANAEQHARLAAEAAGLERRIAEAEALIAAKDAVERDVEVFKRLEGMAGGVRRIAAELQAARQVETEAESARAAAVAIDLKRLAEEQAAAAKTSDGAAKAREEAEARREAAADAERAALEFRSKAEAFQEAEQRVARLSERVSTLEAELERLPALEKEAGRLQQLQEALPALAELLQSQNALEAAKEKANVFDVSALHARLAALDEEGRAAESEAQSLESEFAAAREEEMRLRAALDSLRDHLEQRTASAEEAVCSRCGQPIDPVRAQAEVEELQRKVAAAAEAHAAANGRRSGLGQKQAKLRELGKALAADLEACRRELQAAQQACQAVEAAEATADRRREELLRVAPDSLAAGVRRSPTAAALAAVAERLADVPLRARDAQNELKSLVSRGGHLQAAREEQATATADRERALAALSGNLAAVADASAAHERATAALLQARVAVDAAQAAERDARRRGEEARQHLQDARQQVQELNTRAAIADDRVASHQRTAGSLADTLLDAGLRERALASPEAVLSELEEQRAAVADAPARLEALLAQEKERLQWEGELRAKREGIKAIPPDHRIDPAQAAHELEEAEEAAGLLGHEAQLARGECGALRQRLAQKRDLENERDRAARRRLLFQRLAALLGRNGLQGVLVGSALDTIAIHANEFLERLTGGNLQLILERAKNSDALELLAIDASCMRQPRRIGALSGSQKFRCAVGIAFGIGYYAGAGGMRSIMIDEGFGGLDEAGQRQMVLELKELARYMDRVIVVSHLDAFRDPDSFPHQLVVERRGNASLIRRLD